MLKPGGVFVASTILDTSSGIGSIVGDENIRGLKQVRSLLHFAHAKQTQSSIINAHARLSNLVWDCEVRIGSEKTKDVAVEITTAVFSLLR